jgi:hypothetical protein
MNTTIEKVRERPILFSTAMVKAILEGRKTVTRRVVNPQPIIDEDGIRFPWATFFNSGTVFTWDEDGIGGENWDAKEFPKEDKFQQALKRTQHPKACPHGKEGDRLWIKETFTILDYWEDSKSVQVMYEGGATNVCQLTDREWSKFINWQEKTERKPSLFMFRSLNRITLELKAPGVERLHDITEEDAVREGVKFSYPFDHDLVTRFYEDYLPVESDDPNECPRILSTAKESFESLWQSINGKESWESNPWVWRIEFSKL